MKTIFQDISSTWLHNVPKMVERRGGILPEGRSSVRTSLDWHGGKPPAFVKQQTWDGLEPGLWAVSQYVRIVVTFNLLPRNVFEYQ